jgi:hexosaminidase
MNLLHWHLVDAQSFPCGSAALPELAAKGAYDPSAVYSPQDLADVVAYAKLRGVRVMPEFDVRKVLITSPARAHS